MEQKDSWEKALTKRVGSEVKRLRDQPPKRSAQWLSDRTEELGMKISRARIADMEGTNRGGELKVSELIVLARALETPPVMLLYPAIPDGEVDLFPKHPMPTESYQAIRWFAGDAGYFDYRSGDGDDYPEKVRDSKRRLLPLRLSNQRAELKLKRSQMMQALIRIEEEGADFPQGAMADISEADEQIKAIEDQMRDLGLTVHSDPIIKLRPVENIEDIR